MAVVLKPICKTQSLPEASIKSKMFWEIKKNYWNILLKFIKWNSGNKDPPPLFWCSKYIWPHWNLLPGCHILIYNHSEWTQSTKVFDRFKMTGHSILKDLHSPFSRQIYDSLKREMSYFKFLIISCSKV
jgi:hypothetical protein